MEGRVGQEEWGKSINVGQEGDASRIIYNCQQFDNQAIVVLRMVMVMVMVTQADRGGEIY